MRFVKIANVEEAKAWIEENYTSELFNEEGIKSTSQPEAEYLIECAIYNKEKGSYELDIHPNTGGIDMEAWTRGWMSVKDHDDWVKYHNSF